MSKKDDMMAALEKRQPVGAVPIWEIEFQMWDQASGNHVVLGREFEKLSSREQDTALHANAEIFLSVCEAMHFAALTVPSAYWEHAPGELAYYCLPGDTRFRQLAILRSLAPSDLMLVANSGGVLGMPGTHEYVEFACKLYDAPDEIEERARNYLIGGIETARRLVDHGADMLMTASDLADNHGPFYAPDQMNRFVLPYLHQWVEAIKRMGKYTVLHSDGNLMPCLEALADSGLHALQAIDPVAGMDIRKVKEMTKGRLCLCGNIDCGLLLTGAPEAVYEAARELLVNCKAGGSLVLGCSNATQPDVPLENYRALLEAWKKYGSYT